ncbi:MAG: serine/threonine-protein kinase [Gemmatimonadaceae bacterium]|jgi:predicted Ser/Thr protein kinase|nr:serine/threonine protein kinase [Gemmatimonadota bacterium]
MNTDAQAWADPAPSLARAVAGAFRLVREIGRGGMGVVYLAEDTQLERRVAIKTLPSHLMADAQVRQRFLREARTAAALSHPNIVPIYSAAERDGVVYFTMGYVEGESLAERLLRDGPLDVPAALAIVRQLALALEAAHAANVVHRDIKAENVLLDGAGRAVVTDFGIARVSEAQPITATGTVLGTVHYMSPEQVMGEPLDGRSDLYALGVLLFRMLSGRFPFERANNSAVLVAHVNTAPPRLREVAPHVPASVDALVHDLLAKRREARLASARALLERLDTLAPDDDGAEAPAAALPVPVVIPASPTLPARPLSSAEAEAVWARAAELQANTGVVVPPAQFPAPPAEPALTRGYEAALVKEGAVEAGIAPKYVERAMAEQAAAAHPPTDVIVHAGRQALAAPNVFLGAHSKIEFEAVVEGELSLEAFEDVADIARRSLGDLVSISAVGRTLTISTSVPRPNHAATPRALQLTLSARNGRTTVRAFEDLSQTVTGLFVGLGLGAGFSVGTATLGVLINTGNPGTGVALAAGILVSALGSARLLLGRTVKAKSRELRELVEELARFAAERNRLGAAPPGTLPPDTSFRT